MRKRFAFWLRKVADFIDPRVMPTPADEFIINIRADTEQFESAMKAVHAELDKVMLRAKMAGLQV